MAPSTSIEDARPENVKAILTLTNERPAGWKGETGYIRPEMIKKFVPNPEVCLFYLCGPPPMTAAMKDMLKTMKVHESQWRVEDWEIPRKHDNQGQ